MHAIREEIDAVRIVHDPLPAQGQWDDDPSHSEIKGLPPGESDNAMLIGDLMASMLLKCTLPSVKLKNEPRDNRASCPR